jgi:hypothetical protein
MRVAAVRQFWGGLVVKRRVEYRERLKGYPEDRWEGYAFWKEGDTDKCLTVYGEDQGDCERLLDIGLEGYFRAR